MFNTDELDWNALITGISGRLIQGDLGCKATGISTDTRTLKSGDLFVALQGPRFDAHHYVGQAFEKGAVAALVSAPVEIGKPLSGKGVILVQDTLTALGDLGALWRKRFPVTLIGLSGSNGKTTTKEMVSRILGLEGPTLKNPGNLNNWIGLPLSLFSLNESHRFAVMEMGMNHLKEIARLCRIARPEVGLLTNIGPAHLEGLGSLEAIAQAKGELFEALEPHHWAVVNGDDSRIRDLSRSCQARKITFGLDREADVRADHVSLTPQGLRFNVSFQGREQELQLPIQGAHNVYNALGAAAVALCQGLSLQQVEEGLKGFTLPEHRLELKKGLKGIQLIDDTYNANPASMKAALKAFQSLKKGKRGGLVLGDMLELGSQAVEAHREIGELIGEMGVDFLMTFGPLSKELLSRSLKGVRPPQIGVWAGSHQELVDQIDQVIKEGDLLLIKGSHGMDMEAVVRALEVKG